MARSGNLDTYLSFVQLAELFAIRSLRQRYRIPLARIKAAADFLETELGSRHPLIDQRLWANSHLYFERMPDIRWTATRYGRFTFQEIVDQYLGRMEFGEGNLPDALYPWIGGSTAKSIRIDPKVRFGQPVIVGTGVTVDSVRDRFESGESVGTVSNSYRLRREQVEDALAYAAAQ